MISRRIFNLSMEQRALQLVEPGQENESIDSLMTELEIAGYHSICKYHNKINNISFKGFTETDMDMVFAIITNVRDKGTKRVVFKVEELKKILKIEKLHLTKKQFTDRLIAMNEKLKRLSITCETDTYYLSLTLFPVFGYNKEDETLTVGVSDEFLYLLNNLTNYTYFSLPRFLGISGKYAKTLYRKLCQWRTTGRYSVKIEDFRDIFCIPESYTTNDIMYKVIKPSIQELVSTGKDFNKLNCIVHTKNLRGKPVASYEFVWEPEDDVDLENLTEEDCDWLYRENTPDYDEAMRNCMTFY